VHEPRCARNGDSCRLGLWRSNGAETLNRRSLLVRLSPRQIAKSRTAFSPLIRGPAVLAQWGIGGVYPLCKRDRAQKSRQHPDCRLNRQWAGPDLNYPSFIRETRWFWKRAAANPATLGRVLVFRRPRRHHPSLLIPSWRRWWLHGPTCPRRSERAWWRWWPRLPPPSPRAGREADDAPRRLAPSGRPAGKGGAIQGPEAPTGATGRLPGADAGTCPGELPASLRPAVSGRSRRRRNQRSNNGGNNGRFASPSGPKPEQMAHPMGAGS